MDENIPSWAVEILAQLDRIEAMLGAPKLGAILTAQEAMAYARKNTKWAFRRWCKKWRVSRTGHDRYSKAALDLALGREAGVVRVPASIRNR